MLPGILGIAGFVGEGAVAAAGISQTDSRTTPSTSFSTVDFGAADASRRIVLLVWHGDSNVDPGTTPTASVGGVSATRIEAETTGDGFSAATGCAIFVANPSGTTGTVSVTWGALDVTIVVLRMVGYSATQTDSDGEAGAGSNGQLPLTSLASDCIIAGAGSHTATPISWTNITSRGEEDIGDIRRSWAWDVGKSAGSTIATVTPWSAILGVNSMVGATFPLA